MGQPLTAHVVAVVPDLRPVADHGHPWLRLDSDGGMHLLGSRPDTARLDVIHLDASGAVTGRTPLPAQLDLAPPTGLLDLACDPSGTSLLLATDPDQGTRELTRLGADGSPTWTRPAPFAGAEHVLYRGGLIGYITDGQGRVGEIDLTTGDLRQVIAWRDGAGQIFVGRDLLFFVHLDDRSQQWGVSAVGALGEPGWSVDGRPELEHWLRHPIGADAKDQLYLTHQGVIARLSADGVPSVVGAVAIASGVPADARWAPYSQWQVDADGSILFAVVSGDSTAVVRLS